MEVSVRFRRWYSVAKFWYPERLIAYNNAAPILGLPKEVA